MRSQRHQRGLAAAAIVVVLILALVALILGRQYSSPEELLDQRKTTDANLRRVAEALAQFATLNQRLPCPAAGTSDTGVEDPVGPNAHCSSANGVVPWATLAMVRSDSLDGWGRKISYRVYDGLTGLTQVGGISMTDCNTNASATSTDLTSGKCPSTHYVKPAVFLQGKGLLVQTDTATTGGYAYVLISHGETGVGAFGAEGIGRSDPPSSSALEYRNTQPGSTFDSRLRSAPGVDITNTAYFDDVVLAKSITDVVDAARLMARDWGNISSALLSASTTAGQTITRADMAAALGFTPGYNTGQNSIDFGTFSVTAQGATARNVSSGIGASGEGIGSIGTGSFTQSAATINSSTSESLNIQFAGSEGRYLGITLVDFGVLGGISGTERVRFTFYLGGLQVAQVSKSACSSTNTGNVRANLLLDPDTTFDRVVISARSTTTGSNSTFLVGGLRACSALIGTNSCTAFGADPVDDCP